MPSILIAPGAPYFFMALAGALLAALGAVLAGRSSALAGVPVTLAARPGSRLIAGQLGGIALAAPLLLAVIVGDARGPARALLLAAALAAYLGLGIVLPRRPEVQRQREAADLRRLTPGLIAFVRVALGSFESPLEIMRRYISRPSPRRAPMQNLVAEALRLSQEQRLRPFAALAQAARAHLCRELSEVCDALAQAEAEGGAIEPVLAAQQETLELILQSEFKRMLRRRTMYLLLMVAISLVIGILINLLFVMTGGGSVLGSLG